MNKYLGFLKHIGVVAVFALISIGFFYPVLQSKVLFQSDIVQYIGMSKQQKDHKLENGEESYWTNAAFGGMPTYQLGARYPYHFIKDLDSTLRFLPRPADYLFLLFLSFYVLMLSLKLEYRLAVLGALGFGLSTYFLVVLSVGHNAKAHAIAYLPLLFSGMVLTFRKKYWIGATLTAIAMGLELVANHYQMTYYFMLFCIVLGITFLFRAYKEGELKPFFTQIGILLGAVVIGISTNATSILATSEYSSWSTRGASELSIDPEGNPIQPSTGLDYDYITEYSYGLFESLNLFVPRLVGGSGSEQLTEDSNLFNYLNKQGVPYQAVKQFIEQAPLYWGDQPIVAGPAYLGAIIVFFFVLALFFYKGRYRLPLLIGTALSIALSWGKNFDLLTNLMIDYVPLYDKFRAVSSAQILAEITIPVFAFLGLKSFLNDSDDAYKIKLLQKIVLGFISFGVVLYGLSFFVDFEGGMDAYFRYNYGDDFVEMLIADRKSVYQSDLFRSLVYVMLSATLLWAYTKKRFNTNYFYLALGILIILDLGGVAKRYLNSDNFVSSIKMSRPFEATEIDKQIAQDTSHYRVFDYSEGLNGARTSYFHNSIGGYHAAKPRVINELFEYHIARESWEPLHMLNVKYVIQRDEKGEQSLIVNEENNGNAWFVQALSSFDSQDYIMTRLGATSTRNEAIAVKEEIDSSLPSVFSRTEQAIIELDSYTANHLKYTSSNPDDGFAVFSELYYKNGWNAYIDGTIVPHYRVDFALRGLFVPKGTHSIEFKFEPQVVKTGGIIQLLSFALLLILIGFTSYRAYKNE
jgi:hypothetical protein